MQAYCSYLLAFSELQSVLLKQRDAATVEAFLECLLIMALPCARRKSWPVMLAYCCITEFMHCDSCARRHGLKIQRHELCTVKLEALY